MDEIAATAQGPDAPGWTPVERALLRATEELLVDALVRDSTWKALTETLDQPQVMDFVFTVGTYSMLAMAMRSFGIVAEEDLVPYLPAAALPAKET